MFKELERQIKKIEELDGYSLNVQFDPFSLASIESAVSCAVEDLEKWANCGSRDDLLRAALDQYSEGIRSHVNEQARKLREQGEDMRLFPNGDLGQQLRALAKQVEALSYVEYDEAQDRTIRIKNILSSPPLSTYADVLTNDLDFDEFLEKTNNSGGSMLGSSSYHWPDDDNQKLGMSILLAKYFGENPNELLEHGCSIFAQSNFNRGVQKVYANIYVPMEQDLREYIAAQLGDRSYVPIPTPSNQSDRIFIVHGHDEGMREATARFLEQMGLRPIILHEQQNRGATIIEKLEANSDVGFAIILMSADDEGKSRAANTLELRPRQNVILEAGWFMGRFGRDRTVILKNSNLDMPSDLDGLVWVNRDPSSAWKVELVKELKAAGYDVQMP